MGKKLYILSAILMIMMMLVGGIFAQSTPPPSEEYGEMVEKKAPKAPSLSDEEMKTAKGVFFNYCAGCHGTLRKGATGPDITDQRLIKDGRSQDTLKFFIANGTPGGMPAWKGILSENDIDILSRFLLNEPPLPPEVSLSEMKKSWNLIVPVEKRLKKPQHKRNIENFFGVILRDAGEVAIIDGDTKELVHHVNTGFAVHILRASASGRYFYVIGRDGKATLIDLYMEKPDKVAEVKVCSEARSIDSSKYKGFEDKLAIVGCYWPPHFVVLDGQTLEPKKVVSTRSYTYDTNEYHPEPRVAAIIASHEAPEWIINVKETGYLWFIDYSDIQNMKITQVEAERFLHDGGWDASKRYAMMAANMRNTMVIVDSKTKKLVAKIITGNKPHPGRGANWTDPEYGPVSATPHLGEATVAVWGSDPKGHPQHAWKVVRKLEPKGSGGLFIKTHPKSNHVWIDQPLNPEPEISQSICVYTISKPKEEPQCWRAADHGKVVHFEYNKAGDEVWVAVWDKKGEVIVYDDKTLKEKTRIKGDWLETPTGHFNVYNTQKDIY